MEPWNTRVKRKSLYVSESIGRRKYVCVLGCRFTISAESESEKSSWDHSAERWLLRQINVKLTYWRMQLYFLIDFLFLIIFCPYESSWASDQKEIYKYKEEEEDIELKCIKEKGKELIRRDQQRLHIRPWTSLINSTAYVIIICRKPII